MVKRVNTRFNGNLHVLYHTLVLDASYTQRKLQVRFQFKIFKFHYGIISQRYEAVDEPKKYLIV